jgi:hypothetical protein
MAKKHHHKRSNRHGNIQNRRFEITAFQGGVAASDVQSDSSFDEAVSTAHDLYSELAGMERASTQDLDVQVTTEFDGIDEPILCYRIKACSMIENSWEDTSPMLEWVDEQGLQEWLEDQWKDLYHAKDYDESLALLGFDTPAQALSEYRRSC